MADGAPAPGGPAGPGGFDVEKVKGQLGPNGIIVMAGAAAGVVACILPWFSASIAGVFSVSVNGFDFWQGWMSMLGEVGAGVLMFLIATGKAGANEKNYCLGVLGGGALGALLTLYVLVRSHGGMSIGPFLSLGSAGAILYGGFLVAKAKGALK